MASFSLRNKILLLTLFPLFVSLFVITLIVRDQLYSLGIAEIEEIRHDLMTDRKEMLQHYTEIARSAVQPVLLDTTRSGEEVRQQVLKILRELRYGQGNDGYLFAYGYDGTALAVRTAPELEGQNMLHVKDDQGVYLIRELISAARSGGGFVAYRWQKPSVGRVVNKLSYAAPLPGLDMAIGTGLYIDDLDAHIARMELALEQRIERTLLIVLGVGIVLIMVMFVIAGWFSQTLIKPLKKTVAALREIGKGKGDLTRRLIVETGDEVGDLAHSFNSFADMIQHLVQEVKQGVDELSHSSGRLQKVVKGTHKDLSSQKQQTEQVAAAIEEMAVAVQQVSGSATRAADSAINADEAAISGRREVQETVSSIHHLVNGVNDAADVIEQLACDAEQIGSVVNVIRDIADQTNLLALNAAIEAARAGEQGRGFSVVADEVRTLATRTQQSTQEIQSMVEKLQGGARNAVEAMSESRTSTGHTVARAGQTTESLALINQAVDHITAMNAQIASAAEEQTVAAEEVARSMQHIADISVRTEENAGRVEKSADEVQVLEQRLLSLVGRFQV
ncbi:MAG: methyl-accepting chemotaxis protein [Marinobacterium sp.]|nr:methyl-accepting chemotaxis protein [Marinobacterium sp.]